MPRMTWESKRKMVENLIELNAPPVEENSLARPFLDIRRYARKYLSRRERSSILKRLGKKLLWLKLKDQMISTLAISHLPNREHLLLRRRKGLLVDNQRQQSGKHRVRCSVQL